MNATVYARYSRDTQREASIDDQIRKCQEYAKSRGWKVQPAHIFTDQAKSGALTKNRPGYQSLMRAVKRRAFDVLIVDDLSRLSRDNEERERAMKRFTFHRVGFVAINDGINTLDNPKTSGLVAGIKGAMNEEFLRDLAEKTVRGMEGRVLQGFSGGGAPYGYRSKPIINPGKKDRYGHTEVIGYQRYVHEPEARLVRRIWQMYADGLSPQKIAKMLNTEGIPSPGSRWRGAQVRGQWGASSIWGSAKLGTGILHNPIYIGKVVWNKFDWDRDPDTETRKPRLRDVKGWVTVDVPRLRIIPDTLYTRVQARMDAVRKSDRSLRGAESWKANRPKYLLSGLVKCGPCGANFIIRNRDRMQCASFLNRGSSVCTNNLVIPRAMLEREVIGTLMERVFSKASLNDLIKTITAEVRNRASKQSSNTQATQARLKDAEAAIARLVDHLEHGTAAPDVIEQRLAERQRERDALMRDLKRQPVHGDADEAAKKVERLMRKVGIVRDIPTRLKLLYANVAKSRALLETLIDEIVVDPVDAGVELEMKGNLARAISSWDDALLTILPGEKETVPAQSVATPNGTNSRSVDASGSGGRI